MKQHFLKKIFSSGLQAVAVQVLGAVYFFFISKYLSKDEFGIISWGNAFAVILTTLLGFGLEQVVVRRIAASKSSDWAAAAFLLHSIIGSVLSFAALWLFGTMASHTGDKYGLLPWLFASQALLYAGVPLKQYLNAKHQFTPYGVIAIFSNTFKLILAFIYIAQGKLNIRIAINILIICSAIEFVALAVYVFTRTHFSFNIRFNAYQKLVKESMPQYLAAVFDISLSRLSWILVGLITTDAITGSFSFASRAFEISRLPIFIIAPVILNIFSKMLAGNATMNTDTQIKVNRIFIAGTFFSIFIPLLLNLLWAPVLDVIFNGKYGSSNATEFLLLSACLPLQFFINIAWTLCFSSRKYKQITSITIISASCNLLLNLVLIKYMGSVGAALAFLATTIIQLLLYYKQVLSVVSGFPLMKFAVLILLSVVCYFVSITITDIIWLRICIVTTSYTILAVLLKLINKDNFAAIQLLLKK